MKNKKIFIILIIAVVIIIAMVACIKLLSNKKEIDSGKQEIISNTTLEERIMWSEFLKRNPYISEIEIPENSYLDDTMLVKLAISSKDVETEYINTEDIEKNPVFTAGEGYKKSQKEINAYLEKNFNKAKISYNFIDTYIKDDEYLIIDEDYVYYTNLKLKDKEYILANLEKNGNFKAEIYEYEINDENRNEIEKMLETGVINTKIKTSKTYTITAIIDNNNNICILTKK